MKGDRSNSFAQNSVHLEVNIDITDELKGRKKGDGAQHEEEDITSE